MAADKSESVRVVARCRPMSDKEKENGSTWFALFFFALLFFPPHNSQTNKQKSVVAIDRARGQVSLTPPTTVHGAEARTFTFDAVFDWKCARDVYSEAVFGIVESVLEGYNATVFAYGQTGSGKTFTMEGMSTTPDQQGVIPNVFEHVFSKLTLDSSATHLVRASFFEIYLEEVRDLLSSNSDKILPVRQRKLPNGVEEFYVKDLTTFLVRSPAELEKILRVGQKKRVTASTDMNQRSSRSHAIFTVTVETSQTREGVSHVRVGKLNMVDLAGSERQSKTHATGEQFVQATKINLSLVTLGMVINKLVEGATHIPYRDSNLTRLLQSSLGGSCKTVMIAAISPASYNFDETLGTLRYASHAKKIKNTPKINEDPKDAMLREYEAELAKLRAQLEARRGGGVSAVASGVPTGLAPQQVLAQLPPELLSQLRERTDQEVAKILEAKGYAEKEAARIREQLHESAEQTAALERKLKMMEGKLVGGAQSLVDENQRQRALLEQQRLSLEQKQAEEARIKRQLLERAERRKSLQERVGGLEQTRNMIDSKLRELRSAHEAARQEIADIRATFAREKEDALERIRALKAELELRSLFVRYFVPADEVTRVERRAIFDDARECWVLRPVRPEDLQLDRASIQYLRQSGEILSRSPQPLDTAGGPMSVSLDMPETYVAQEYESNAAARELEARLRAAVSEDDADEGVSLRASENLPNVFLGSPMDPDEGHHQRTHGGKPPATHKTIAALSTGMDRSRSNSAPPRRRNPLGGAGVLSASHSPSPLETTTTAMHRPPHRPSRP